MQRRPARLVRIRRASRRIVRENRGTLRPALPGQGTQGRSLPPRPARQAQSRRGARQGPRVALLPVHQGRPGHPHGRAMGSDRPRLSGTNEHPSRRRRGRRDMARGAPRIEQERQRPRARDGATRHGRRMDQHVQRHERRAAIMPRNGTGTVRTRRDRPVEHGKPGQVPVRGMAALGRMESTGGLRRAAPLACARQGRARPANRDRGRGDDAETARRPDRGGVREGVPQRGRVHPTRPPRGLQHRPASAQGRGQGFVRFAGSSGRIPDHMAQQGRLDGTVQRDRPRRGHEAKRTARRLDA